MSAQEVKSEEIRLIASISGEECGGTYVDGTTGVMKKYRIVMLVGPNKMPCLDQVLNHYPTDKEYNDARVEAMMTFAGSNFQKWVKEA